MHVIAHFGQWTFAELPDPLTYFNPLKMVTVLVLLLLWALAAEWADKDTNLVKTKREQWNMIVLAGGVVGFLVLIVPPWQGVLFFAGIVTWLAFAGGGLLAYLLHRNGRVVPEARVMTSGHFKRLLSGDPSKKAASKDKGQQVRITDHSGEFVGLPSDPDQRLDYEVAQDFLYDALWRRASDVDLLVGKDACRVVYRIDGVAKERPEPVSMEDAERLVRYLKQLAGLNTEEIRRPQTGKIKAALLAHVGDIGPTEVHTSGSTAGERLRLKTETGVDLLRTKELGLPAPRMEALRGLLERPSGMVLCSAPPKHGLTTSLYAILRGHDAYIQNIHTLERRLTLDLDNITQRVYDGTNDDVNYARMLQSVLRREPDVVMVSECEDHDTAAIAGRAAGEDRKIYMGITAQDCFDALSKYLRLLDDNAAASKALIGVINQRLIRLLCTECREAFKPDPTTLKKLNLPVDKIDRFHRPPTEPLVDKKGREIICPNCQGSGYVKRTGVFEMLVVDEGVAALIAEGASINRIKSQCRKNKMYYLQEEALLKVIDGTTSMQEVLRCLRNSTK